ncbi:hypothetical protein BDZ45DRAFT_691619 [Acephala macrosclerotiorum]|nr:hypothetical protein BDZ45DRAFT_691619 [Acephala macrosclerotiorum]
MSTLDFCVAVAEFLAKCQQVSARSGFAAGLHPNLVLRSFVDAFTEDLRDLDQAKAYGGDIGFIMYQRIFEKKFQSSEIVAYLKDLVDDKERKARQIGEKLEELDTEKEGLTNRQLKSRKFTTREQELRQEYSKTRHAKHLLQAVVETLVDLADLTFWNFGSIMETPETLRIVHNASLRGMMNLKLRTKAAKMGASQRGNNLSYTMRTLLTLAAISAEGKTQMTKIQGDIVEVLKMFAQSHLPREFEEESTKKSFFLTPAAVRELATLPTRVHLVTDCGATHTSGS